MSEHPAADDEEKVEISVLVSESQARDIIDDLERGLSIKFDYDADAEHGETPGLADDLRWQLETGEDKTEYTPAYRRYLGVGESPSHPMGREKQRIYAKTPDGEHTPLGMGVVVDEGGCVTIEFEEVAAYTRLDTEER